MKPKKVFRAFALLSILVLVISSGMALSELITPWTHEKLNKQAEIVAIVSPVETVETGKKVSLKNKGIEGDLVEIKTTVRVNHVIKGTPEARIDILHFKIESSDIGFVNGPMLATFRTKAITVKSGDRKYVLPPSQYLVYLKKSKEGTYSLFTDYNQASDSVYELLPPVLE